MKKLLVVMLVLAMAGMANAAMELTLSATTVEIGGTIDVTITAPVQITEGGYYIGILDSSAGDATFDLDYPVVIDYLGTPTTINLEEDPDIMTDICEDGIRQWYISMSITDTVAPTDPVKDTLFSHVRLTGVTAGLVTIALFNQDYVAGNTYDIMVPEPITIGLLGLGGLFLRRRK
jgi:hypothetical protein